MQNVQLCYFPRTKKDFSAKRLIFANILTGNLNTWMRHDLALCRVWPGASQSLYT